MYPGEVIMKKVELRMNEQNKYEIIKKLVETDENKKRAATSAVPLDIKNKTISLYINDFKEFDAPKEAPKKEKKKYIPPMNHPWRKASFVSYAAKQKHRYGANV